MHVQIEDQGPVKKRVSVTVPAQRVARQFHTAYNQLAQRVSVPGFRQGKVPQKHLEQRYGARVAADVAQDLIDEAWRKVIDDHGVTPVSRPEVEAGPARPTEDYTFSLTVEVPPRVDLVSYEGLPVEQTEWNIPDDRVEHELTHLQEHAAKWQDIADRDVAQKGDQAVIDFHGSVGGKPFPNGAGNDNEIELGSGRFIPGFEDQILGRKVGETFDIVTTFPEAYQAAHLAGKEAVFHTTLKKIQTKVTPEIGPALAEALGEESIDALRKQVRDNMAARFKQQSDREAHEALRRHLATQYTFDLPPSMVEGALADQRQQMMAEAQQGGLDLELARRLAEENVDQARTAVLDSLRVQLVLDAIADREKIEVTEKDLSATIDQMARSLGPQGARVRQAYRDPSRRASLRSRLRQDKVLEFLLSKATVTRVTKDVPAHDHGPAAEEASA